MEIKIKKLNRKILTGDKKVDKLYKAVRDYIESKNGSVVVIGGISISRMPDDFKFNYRLVVGITGKKPVFTPHDTNKKIKIK